MKLVTMAKLNKFVTHCLWVIFTNSVVVCLILSMPYCSWDWVDELSLLICLIPWIFKKVMTQKRWRYEFVLCKEEDELVSRFNLDLLSHLTPWTDLALQITPCGTHLFFFLGAILFCTPNFMFCLLFFLLFIYLLFFLLFLELEP